MGEHDAVWNLDGEHFSQAEDLSCDLDVCRTAGVVVADLVFDRDGGCAGRLNGVASTVQAELVTPDGHGVVLADTACCGGTDAWPVYPSMGEMSTDGAGVVGEYAVEMYEGGLTRTVVMVFEG